MGAFKRLFRICSVFFLLLLLSIIYIENSRKKVILLFELSSLSLENKLCFSAHLYSNWNCKQLLLCSQNFATASHICDVPGIIQKSHIHSLPHTYHQLWQIKNMHTHNSYLLVLISRTKYGFVGKTLAIPSSLGSSEIEGNIYFLMRFMTQFKIYTIWVEYSFAVLIQYTLQCGTIAWAADERNPIKVRKTMTTGAGIQFEIWPETVGSITILKGLTKTNLVFHPNGSMWLRENNNDSHRKCFTKYTLPACNTK